MTMSLREELILSLKALSTQPKDSARIASLIQFLKQRSDATCNLAYLNFFLLALINLIPSILENPKRKSLERFWLNLMIQLTLTQKNTFTPKKSR